MKIGFLIGCFMMASVSVAAACSVDSVKVTTLMKQAQTVAPSQNKILYLAKGFQGTPYQGGTLETFPVEQLVVRTDSVDCTTFVEYVLAMYLTPDASFAGFKKALEMIRYRHGQLDGYTSRLHYFSDWIYDNERKGIVREVTKESPYAVRKVDLNFMSEHASLYPFLAQDTAAVLRMKQIESRWIGYQMPYIPKEKLDAGPDLLKVSDGDVLTLATRISGLDVVHVGFACWVEGRLHLLHASSVKKKVLLDPLTLYDYSKNIKSHIGIRVIRIQR